MNDNANMMPELTLDGAAAAQVETPQLVLGNEAPAAPEPEKKVEPVKID